MTTHPRRALGELIEAFGGGTPSKKAPEYWSGAIPWVSPKDMKRWHIDDAVDHISTAAISETSCKLIPPPAVLMVVRGMILAHSVPVAVSRVPVAINQDMKAFRPKEGLDAEYLALVLTGAREALLERVDIAGHGTRRLPSDAWADLKVPVPELEQQRRIVQRDSGALSRIEELLGLHERRRADLDELRLSLVLGDKRGAREWVPVSEYFHRVADTEPVVAGRQYAFAGVKSFGKGLFASGTKNSNETRYTRLRRVSAGDFVYPKLMAWEGAFGMVPPGLDGFVVSPEFMVFRPAREGLFVEVLDTYFRSSHSLEDVRGGSPGSNRRRRRLHPDAFLQLRVPKPPDDVQVQLKAVYDLQTKSEQEWSDRTGELMSLRQAVCRAAFAGGL